MVLKVSKDVVSIKSMPKEFYQKLYLFFSALVGIDLLIFLTLGLGFRKLSRVPVSPTVNFSFVKVEESQTPNINFQLLMDPRSYKVSFVKVKIYFDPTLMQLTDQIKVEGTPLSQISITPLTDANNTGNIEITMAQPPGVPPPNSLLRLANLIFKRVGDNPSDVTLVDEDTQVIGSNSQVLPFTANYAIVDPSTNKL